MKLQAVFEQSDGLYCACKVSGHADYTEQDPQGQILCAAVSSAMQLTCNTLSECFHAETEIEQNPDDGVQNMLSLRLPKPDSVQSEILHGLLIHFQALAEDFPGMMTVKIR
ncbi:MAG: ribosomal-processing cysteine protease Prp [Oscillospiraceae bacterium]|nr:ribosomal-processing cysteine protease Prp [Oscillospiraceae bacterium]